MRNCILNFNSCKNFNALLCALLALLVNTDVLASSDMSSPWAKYFTTPDSKSLNLAVSYVWSGHEIKDHNIDTFKGFRKSFPNIPIIHFISSSYFARGSELASKNAQLIKQTMVEGDRVGILLAGWKSEIQQSNVIFKNSPTFWGTQLNRAQCTKDCGIEVPLTVYSKDEISKLVKNAKSALEAQNFGNPVAIKVEGFISSPEIMEVASENEIYLDFTVTSSKLVNNKLAPYPLNNWVNLYWSELQAKNLPFDAKVRNNSLLVVPQSIGTIDYLSVQEVGNVFRDYLESYEKSHDNASKLGTIAISIHQSTAYNEMPKLIQTLKNIYHNSNLTGYALIPLALPGNTLNSNGSLSEAPIDSKSMKVIEPTMYPEFQDRFEIHSH